MNGVHEDVTTELNIIKTPLSAVQASNVFFLEQVLGYDADKETIINEAVKRYPPDLLVGNREQYILVDVGQRHPPHRDGILSAKTKKFIEYGSLDEFVQGIESAGKGVVVSFGQEDFDRFSDAVGQRELWRMHDAQQEGRLYKVHKYGISHGRRNGR